MKCPLCENEMSISQRHFNQCKECKNFYYYNDNDWVIHIGSIKIDCNSFYRSYPGVFIFDGSLTLIEDSNLPRDLFKYSKEEILRKVNETLIFL
jgi:hypothetical protein